MGVASNLKQILYDGISPVVVVLFLLAWTFQVVLVWGEIRKWCLSHGKVGQLEIRPFLLVEVVVGRVSEGLGANFGIQRC